MLLDERKNFESCFLMLLRNKRICGECWNNVSTNPIEAWGAVDFEVNIIKLRRKLMIDYIKEALRTCKDPYSIFYSMTPPHMDAVHAALGISTEAGEIVTLVKKYALYGKSMIREEVCDEVGDLLWYIALLLRVNNLTFEECMTKNVVKLKARFPDKYSDDQALNKNPESEAAAMQSLNTNMLAVQNEHQID